MVLSQKLSPRRDGFVCLGAGFLCFLTRELFFLVIMVAGCTEPSKGLLVNGLSGSLPVETILSASRKAPVTFEEMLADLQNARVIYVGERHIDTAHHRIQLKIIQALYQREAEMAVGMEMFDKTYQPVLDEWSAGYLDTIQFLQKTHWYANWRLNFELYRQVLEFVRANGIRLVGLNIPPHIPPKIREGGIENLLPAEKAHLPGRIDTQNMEHRAYIEGVFEKHKFRERVKFEDFYMAQNVWEETMAEAINANLGGGQMVVLTGNGHIVKKFGVPDRVYARNRAPFRTVYLASAGSKAELSYGDYIWVTP